MDFEMCESLHSTTYTAERTTPKHATQQRGREGVKQEHRQITKGNRAD